MKKLIFMLLFIIPALILSSCNGGGNNEDKSYRVTVITREGLTVTGENPIEAKEGADVTFNVTVGDNYVVRSVTGGVYDRETSTLTVADVSDDVRVDFTLSRVDYNANQKFTYYVLGNDDYESTLLSSSEVWAGTEVTVKATDNSRTFVGWSFGSSLSAGGKIVSQSREFTFDLDPAYVKDSRFVLVPNYTSAAMYRIDTNGGSFDTESDNAARTGYYTVSHSDGTVSITLTNECYEKMGCAALFYDDGTFSREGYTLIEYNTKPDGTGTGYSLGSKLSLDPMNVTTLYCIWAKDTPAADFLTENLTLTKPAFAKYVPHWNESGVTVTKYLGNSETVVIPSEINGKAVIGISRGAFENKALKTLVIGRNVLKIEDGAVIGCEGLETVYYSDGVCYVSDAALDAESRTSLKNFYVNATVAPRYSNTKDGAFSVKLSKLMASADENRIVVVGGSSAYQGLGTAYLEALLGDYTVINFGTTRTTNGLLYLEAVAKYTHEGDIVLASPENSIYMMGENTLYWKTLRDIEGMYNLFRCVDISNYDGVLTAFADFNQNYRFQRAECAYEDIVKNISDTVMNTDGDAVYPDRAYYCGEGTKKYLADAYLITLSSRVKSASEADWQNQSKDYTNPDDPEWCDFTDKEYSDAMNRAFAAIKASGAKVLFSFAPVDREALIPEADSPEWQAAYDKLIADTYTSLDGMLGSSSDYVFDRKYFYDCAFHLNDYGRTLRTYQVYLDLCEYLGRAPSDMDLGKDFQGCLFE